MQLTAKFLQEDYEITQMVKLKKLLGKKELKDTQDALDVLYKAAYILVK